ncbi:vanadium-dependent haloperoxidase [Spirosoma sp. KCTC 42546]|uniref:vanadium-dependent haloperoxidase n=1 Tax=Spirosoma sp. KCTC 42546 TaxID=2520506 RepID=UPI0011591ED1|nr:vanadium-dependent haloperoxidase [Spirosoma sp. KCTC 42546]QDK82892.1 vanadium-dependent haloperoxidase [Spirosoma sp. KCTC 42546]
MNIHFTHRKLQTSKANSKHNYRGVLTTLLLIAFLQACRIQPSDDVQPTLTTGKPADQYTGDIATTWAALQLKLTKTTAGFTPPVASRAFGYAGITMYESVVPGIANRKSLVSQLQGLTTLPQVESGKAYNWALSANAAQAQILRSLYPTTSATNKVYIDSLETVILKTFKDTDESINQRSIDFGKKIADALFEWSKTDGGDAGYTRNFPASYVVPVGAGLWQPTENGQKIPMQPYWGKNRTFVKSNNDLPMPKPLAYSTDVKSAIFSQYMDVYNKSKSLTQTEKEISLWWSDNPGDSFTPPGHSYSLARIAAVTAKANLAKAAETFARTGISVADAFILCWRCKFTYNNLRPYTYVRLAIDPAWVPFWPAPPFPGYPSGHATQSSSAATVLTALYGENFAFTDDSHVGRPDDPLRHISFKARSFTSFAASAQESADSRFYGNIHTKQDNETGLTEGKKIGANVNALAWEK